MFIIAETDYAIRIIDYLAKNSSLVSSVKISEATGVSLRFAKNILQKLTGKDLVVSYQGPSGGYKLNRNPEEISLCDVYEAIQGPVVLGRGLSKEKSCDCREDQSPYFEIFIKLSKEIEDRLCEVRFSTSKVDDP